MGVSQEHHFVMQLVSKIFCLWMLNAYSKSIKKLELIYYLYHFYALRYLTDHWWMNLLLSKYLYKNDLDEKWLIDSPLYSHIINIVIRLSWFVYGQWYLFFEEFWESAIINRKFRTIFITQFFCKQILFHWFMWKNPKTKGISETC